MKSAPYASRSEYLGFVAHEVRNPLATALWSAELLGRLAPGDRGGERGAKLAATTQRAITRMARLIEDHFLAERLDCGDYPLQRAPVALAEALREAAARAAPTGGCEVDCAPDLEARADRSLLLRASEALAAAAGGGGAPVRLEGREVSGGVAVLARGAALAAGVLEAPGKGSEPDPSGRSLGLVAALAIATAHGGAIALEGGALVMTLPAGEPG